MAEAIGAVAAFGIGVGLSPIPVIAVILVLFSRRAATNGVAYLFGWLLGLSVLGVALWLAADLVGIDPGAGDSGTRGWVRLVAGVLLLALAVRTWRRRPGPGDEPRTPGWMSGVEDLSAGGAVRLGALLACNPKNILLTVGAVASLRSVELSGGQALLALVVYVLLGSALVVAAVAYHRVGGRRAQEQLETAKQWLQRHNAAVMSTLFAVFGFVLAAQGVAALR